MLGFKIEWREGDFFGAVSSGQVSMFFRKQDEPQRGCECVLNTPNADEVFKVYRQRGVKIIEPIATHPWGMREFTIEDINGHYLCIGHVDESCADYSSFESPDDKSA